MIGMKSNKKLPFSEQEKLINYCISDKVELNRVLESYGYTYENLRYRNNPPIQSTLVEYRELTDYEFPIHGVPTVSFFSGAGGLDLGFERAGFHHLVSFEINELFCETLRKNRPNWQVFGPPDYSGDIRNREEIADILHNEVGIKVPFEGVFHGGPPCQPFSIAANQRFTKSSENFKRIGFDNKDYGNLLVDFIWQIHLFQPRVFLIENVTGLMTIDGGEQLSQAIKLLTKLGYEVMKPAILDAKFYGVPQSRGRLFLCGWRGNGNKTFKLPAENFLKIPCYKVFEKPVDNLPNHITRQHKAPSIIRYMELEYGQRDHLGRVDRLDPNLPSKTVIAGGMKGGGRSHLHPSIPRTLSPRESARLQTFPDNYTFCGPSARQLTQVGNAVPPLLGMKLARAIFDSLLT